MFAYRGASIALDIAKGIYYLHSHNIMHLDLKSPNILLAADYSAKLADVGLSRIFTTQSMPVAMVSNPANGYSMTTVHTARCSIYCDAWLCDSICLPSRRFYSKHVQQQLKMHTAPAVLTRMHSVDRAYHVHFGLYYALEQLGIARSAWAQSAP